VRLVPCGRLPKACTLEKLDGPKFAQTPPGAASVGGRRTPGPGLRRPWLG
jgi:hypothetical protein